MQFASLLSIILGLQILVTHAIALELYLYWTVWWLDIVMHLLGGMLLVFIWRVLINYAVIAQSAWNLTRIFQVSLPLLIGWEIFGVYLERGFKDGYLTDTSGDILCGIVGIMIGFWLLQRLETQFK